VRATDTGRIVEARLLEAARFQVLDALGSMLLHIFLGAEHQGSGRAGLDARRLHAHSDTIGAQRALIGLVVALGDARNVERACGHAVAAADAVLLLEVHDAVGVLHDGARGRTGLEAARIGAVHAAVLADQPFEIAFRVLVLREAHQRPRAVGEIGGILVAAEVRADIIAQIVPLHARDLAGLTAYALGGVDELRDCARVRAAHLGGGAGGSRASDDVE